MLANNGHVATWCYKCSHCRTKVPRKLRLKHCRWRKQKQKDISLSLSCTQYQTSIAVILKHVVVSMKAKYKYFTWNIHDMKRMCVFSRHAVANILLHWLHLLGFSPPAHICTENRERGNWFQNNNWPQLSALKQTAVKHTEVKQKEF